MERQGVRHLKGVFLPSRAGNDGGCNHVNGMTVGGKRQGREAGVMKN